MNKVELLNEFYPKGLDKPYNKNKGKDNQLINVLKDFTPYLTDDVTISERLFCLKNDLRPNVCECGNKTKFKSPKDGYAEFCSRKCMNSSNKTKERRKQTTIESQGGLGFASKKISEKVKKTNLKKYGVEVATQNKDVRNKISDTWKDVNKDDMLEKRKKTNLEKYGAEHHQQNLEQKEKIKNGLIKNQGGVGFASKKISEKISQTNLERYGAENAMLNEEVQEKLKQTIQKKYGVDNPTKSIEIIEKRKFNNIKKWGVSSNSQLHISDENLKIISDPILFENKLGEIGGAYSLSKELGVSIHTVLNKIKKFGIVYETQGTFSSSFEDEIVHFLKQHIQTEIVQSDRKILSGKELDIVIPDKNVAIEMNGVYWHSENAGGKDKFYHYNKTDKSKENGYQLLHVYDTEWLHKNDIVKSLILSKLGLNSNRIYARKCIVRELDNTTKNNFLLENHLQGKDTSEVRLGLFYDEQLYAVMTFSKSRFSKKYEWELVRFANKQYSHVVGGASKLFKYFIKTYDPKSIVTYADRRYSDGSFYETIGFDFIHVSDPNYFYWKSNNPLFSNTMYSRNRFQKHKLKNILENFDASKSEWENMQMNGFDRIWDSGNYVFKWERD